MRRAYVASFYPPGKTDGADRILAANNLSKPVPTFVRDASGMREAFYESAKTAADKAAALHDPITTRKDSMTDGTHILWA